MWCASFPGDGADIVTDTPEEFRRRFVAADIAKWRKVVAAAHIKDRMSARPRPVRSDQGHSREYPS